MKKFGGREIVGERRMKMRNRPHWLLGAALFGMIAGGPTPSAGEEPLVEKYVLGNGLNARESRGGEG